MREHVVNTQKAKSPFAGGRLCEIAMNTGFNSSLPPANGLNFGLDTDSMLTHGA